MKQGHLLSAIVLVVLMCSLLSSAQVGTYQPSWRVNVPFSFHAGNRVMAAGTYHVSWQSGAIRIANESTNEAATILSYSKDETLRASTGFLRFAAYGEEKFLHEVCFAGQKISNAVASSKFELEMAKDFSKSAVVVAQQNDKSGQKSDSTLDKVGQ